MRRLLIFSAFVFVFAFVLMPTAAIPQSSAPSQPEVLDYWQAKARGWEVGDLPSETGYRVCKQTDFRPGFKTAEELDAAIQAFEQAYGADGLGPNYCQVDPRNMDYTQLPGDGSGLLTAEPQSSQEAVLVDYTGGILADGSCTITSQTHRRNSGTLACSSKVEGVRADIEVGNPSLCHGSCSITEFVYGRVSTFTAGGHSAEMGWIEYTAYSTGQWPVASFDGAGARVPVELDQSRPYYGFRVRHNGPGGGPGEVVWEWFDGSWRNAKTVSGIWCMDSNNNNTCNTPGLATEVYSENDSWFDMIAPADGEGVNYKTGQFRENPNVWKQFYPNNYSDGISFDQSPYSICSLTKWYLFRTPRGTC